MGLIIAFCPPLPRGPGESELALAFAPVLSLLPFGAIEDRASMRRFPILASFGADFPLRGGSYYSENWPQELF